MSNPQLNKIQISKAKKLLEVIRKEIEKLANNDIKLVFAFRRKIYKELTYDERGTPMERKKLKDLLRKKQNGFCFECKNVLPKKGTVLDRIKAVKRYNEKNVNLICPDCDKKIQEKRNYK